MKSVQMMGYAAAAVLSFSLVLLLPGTSSADKQVNAGVILVISDEIFGRSVEIERVDGGAPPGGTLPGSGPTVGDDGGDPGDPTLASGDDPTGNDNNRSGFGDDSTPGLESDNNNSGNDGYDNPSNAPDTVGQSSQLR